MLLEKRGNIRIMVEVEGWIIYVRFILENIFYLLNKRIIYPKIYKIVNYLYSTRICFDTLPKCGGYVCTLKNWRGAKFKEDKLREVRRMIRSDQSPENSPFSETS